MADKNTTLHPQGDTSVDLMPTTVVEQIKDLPESSAVQLYNHYLYLNVSMDNGTTSIPLACISIYITSSSTDTTTVSESTSTPFTDFGNVVLKLSSSPCLAAHGFIQDYSDAEFSTTRSFRSISHMMLHVSSNVRIYTYSTSSQGATGLAFLDSAIPSGWSITTTCNHNIEALK